MKNTKFLKQNLLIDGAVLFSWIACYYVDFYNIWELWLLFLLLTVIYLPLTILRHNRVIKDKDTAILTKSINVIIYILISACLLSTLYDFFDEMYFLFTIEGDFLILPFYSYFTVLGFGGIYDLFLQYSPCLIAAVLLYFSIKNKKLKEEK